MGAVAMGVIGWVITACSGDRRKTATTTKPVIAVSIPPQLFLLDSIAGDRIETFCLLESSSDPEMFEPSMNQLVALEQADSYVPIGSLPFEKPLIERLKSNRPDLLVSPASDGIVELKGTHDHDGKHSENEVDPHVWSSVKNARMMALNILNMLVSVDSKNEDFYRANYGRLDARLDSIDKEFTGIFEKMDSKPSFVVWHPSLSYFARDYGLNQVSLSDAGKEKSVKGMIERIDKIKDQKATVYFYQKEFDSDRAKAISEETGAKIIEINPMNREWEDEMQKLYDAFTLN